MSRSCWYQRAVRGLGAVTLLFGAACSETAPVEASPLGRAKDALTALVDQDGIEVAQCRELADRCSERSMGAAPADVCARHPQRCDALEAHLSELRKPALSCWRRSLRTCADDSPERARCQEMMDRCKLGDHELSRSREPVLKCAERVEACLAHAVEVAGSGAACERIEASCARLERPVAAHHAGG